MLLQTITAIITITTHQQMEFLIILMETIELILPVITKQAVVVGILNLYCVFFKK